MKKLLKKLVDKKQKAETLIEVLIALLVVGMGAATATSLVVTSIQSNVYNKDTLIANNLAIEGIEKLRNMRDSNWLKFSFDTVTCWNIRPAESACEKKILPGFYSLGETLSEKLDNDLDLKEGNMNNNALFQIKYYDLNIDGNDPKADSNQNGDISDDRDFAGSHHSYAKEVGSSNFYRSISISYTDTQGNKTDENTGQVMKVTSKVQWYAQGILRNITLTSDLTNYKK